MRIEQLLTMGLEHEQAKTAASSKSVFTLRHHLIQHPVFCEAVREIARIHHRWSEARIPESLLLVGQSGSGKSTLLQYYHKQFPRQETREGVRIPVLLVNTPESPTVKTLAEAILMAMEDPAASKGTAQQKTFRIIHFFEKCQINLLMLDEFQHFFDGRRASETQRVSDWLKNLINTVKVPILLCGLPRAIHVVNMNQQLRRRFGSPFYFRPFRFTTEDEQTEFRGVLKSIESIIRRPDTLSEANLARRFYYASNGLLDYVIKVIDDAISRSGTSRSNALTMEHLYHSFLRTVWSTAPHHLNPFSAQATLRHLHEPGEPFELWDPLEKYLTGVGVQGGGARKASGKAKKG